MAADCDLVIVVGSTNSSNSVRLVEVALEAGARDSHLVDFAAEIDPAWLDGVGTVGVTSGASVPEVLVNEVLDWLAERGFADVEPVKAAEERLVFVAVAVIDVVAAPSASFSVTTLATLLIRGFPAMGISTGIALVIALIRGAARR